MKTIGKIELEINDLINDASRIGDIKKEDVRRKMAIRNRIQYLRKIKAFLETNPSEGYLKKEIKRLESRKTSIENGFDSAYPSMKINDKKKAKSFYLRENGVSHINVQLETLDYILD